MTEWKRLVGQVKRTLLGQLEEWRTKYERNSPRLQDDLMLMAREGVSLYEPLFSIAKRERGLTIRQASSMTFYFRKTGIDPVLP
jgi:hypothetical protein